MTTRTINGVTLTLLKGNIAEVRADAIVNAANSALRTIIQHIQQPTGLQQVMVVLYGDVAFQAFERSLSDFQGDRKGTPLPLRSP